MEKTVSVVRCGDYNIDLIEKAVKQAIDAIGGICKYINAGDKVLIKPNLIAKKTPDEATTTHPAVVEAIVKIVKNAGGIVTIADSPGGHYSSDILKSIYLASGMEKVAANTDAILNYDLGETQIKNPDGKYLKTLNVINPVAEADVIINVPKLKTHGQMVYTGAVKNMFGIIPGLQKGEYHFRMSEHEEFAHALIDIFLSSKPTLNIMDAVVGMEGKGPTAGEPRNIGVILASEDAFALDVAAVSLIAVNPSDVPTIKNAISRKLSPANTDNINIIGEDINELVIKDFSVPALKTVKSITFLNERTYKLLKNILKPKPVFMHKKCTSCGVCSEHCPAKIIVMKRGYPYVDLSKCIRCFCCQELCPSKAIDIKQGAVFRMLTNKKHSSK